MRSQSDISSGMSCSTTSTDAPWTVAEVAQERERRLGLALGEPGGRLVEQHDRRAAAATTAARSHTLRMPVESSPTSVPARSARPKSIEHAPALSPLVALGHPRPRARRQRRHRRTPDGSRRSAATITVSSTVSPGYRRRVLERAAEPEVRAGPRARAR